MAIEKERWLKEKITKDSKPNWPCPTCGLGELIFPDNWAKSELSARSVKEDPIYLDQFPQEIEKHFAGLIKCSNSQCQESISVCGVSSYDQHWDEVGSGPKDIKYYYPMFFFPPLHIFKIDSYCPTEISQQLIKSFSHFFNDPWASANAVRTALELMMDDQAVKKQFKSSSGKIKKYDLHARIEIFGNKNPDIKPFLMAAKWIGNAGSHSKEITKQNVLEGYALMDHAIYELYVKDKRINSLKRTAAVINRIRKPKTLKNNAH